MDDSVLINDEQLSKMTKPDLVVLVSTLLKKRHETLLNFTAERELYETTMRRLEEREAVLSVSLRQERDQRKAWKHEIETLEEWVRAANDDLRDERHRRQTLERKQRTVNRTPNRTSKPAASVVVACDAHLL